jgi:hypothetical protein
MLLLVATAGVTALTTLTALTHLMLEGDGCGIAELALKARSLSSASMTVRVTTAVLVHSAAAGCCSGHSAGDNEFAKAGNKLTTLCIRALAASQVWWRPLHAQLPALERLDLVFTEVPPPEAAGALGRLSTLASLTALLLQAGSANWLLRHLRLSPSVQAGSVSSACPSTSAGSSCEHVNKTVSVS